MFVPSVFILEKTVTQKNMQDEKFQSSKRKVLFEILSQALSFLDKIKKKRLIFLFISPLSYGLDF